jgi:hypothetical protein
MYPTTPHTEDTLSPAFRAALTDLLSRATAQHPTCAGKISKAAHLVELGHVAADRGGFTVASETTAGTTYWVDRTSCTCPDFQARGAYCKHQWAVGLQRAIERRLAAERWVCPAAAAAPIPYAITAAGHAYLDGAQAALVDDLPAPGRMLDAAYRTGYLAGRQAYLAQEWIACAACEAPATGSDGLCSACRHAVLVATRAADGWTPPAPPARCPTCYRPLVAENVFCSADCAARYYGWELGGDAA